MKIHAPKITDSLPYITQIQTLSDVWKGIRFVGVDFSQIQGKDFAFQGCVLERCHFTGGDWQRTDWQDVRFVRCELSGANFQDSLWQRCEFQECKMTGTVFYGAAFHHTKFIDCKAPDVDFRSTRWKYAELKYTLFRKALWGNTTFSHIAMEACNFSEVNFFQTALAQVDFRTCILDGISVVGKELQGMIVTREQAADLARLLGIVVQE